MRKILNRIENFILGFLFSRYKEELLDIVESRYKSEINDYAKSIIFYIQENIEEGHPISIIVSSELASSEFGIIVDKTGEGIDKDMLEQTIKEITGDKKVH